MTVFSRGVPLNQFQVLFTSCIDICLSCIAICIDICLQVVTRCLCVVICLQVVTRCHLFTSCYNVLQVHVSPRSEVTFGNDVALRKALRKKGLEIYIIYYSSPCTTKIPYGLLNSFLTFQRKTTRTVSLVFSLKYLFILLFFFTFQSQNMIHNNKSVRILEFRIVNTIHTYFNLISLAGNWPKSVFQNAQQRLRTRIWRATSFLVNVI